MGRRLSSGAEQAEKLVTHGLSHLHKVWAGVLPTRVYLMCIGTLLNTVMEELIEIVTSLEDISADAGEQLVTILKQLQDKSPALFDSESQALCEEMVQVQRADLHSRSLAER